MSSITSMGRMDKALLGDFVARAEASLLQFEGFPLCAPITASPAQLERAMFPLVRPQLAYLYRIV